MQPISVVIPTLNEADNLPPLFERLDQSLSRAGIPYEIIVVDDHSTDATASLVRLLSRQYNASLLMKQGKPGKAFSLLEGFAAAEHELICMIDADLQYPPEVIRHMYHKLQYCEADIVVTERVANQTGPLRRLFSAGFNLLFTRLLFGIKYDAQSGLKLFRKSLLKTLTIEPSPWTFDLEFIVKALEHNYIVVSQEIEFSQRNAGVPKVHLLSATWEIATGSLKLRRNTIGSRVKSSYRYSELLQRSTNIAISVVLATAVLAGLGPLGQSSSALNLPELLPGSSHSDKAGQGNQNNQPISPGTDSDSDKESKPTPAAPTTAPTKPAAPSAAAAAPAQSANSASNSSTADATPAGSNVNAVKPTEADGLRTNAGKNAKYYPQSKLSSSKTQSLLWLAALVVLTGATLIALSALIYGLRALIMRIRQPIRA